MSTQPERERANREAARRVRRILDTGRWPSGLSLAPYERPLLERNCAPLLALVR